LTDKSKNHLRKSSQDYVGTFTNLKPGHKRAVTSLGGGNLMAKSHANRFFTRANTNNLVARNNRSFNSIEEDEITRQLQNNI